MAIDLNGWVPIFRAGTHIDSKGAEGTWTNEDIDRIASQYNPESHEAPVVVGHPSDNAPAFGWVEAMRAESGMLLAKFRDVLPEFKDMVSNGLYKKRSISIYPDGTLRHVGFLGAMPPAIKGLPDFSFREGEAVTIELSESIENNKKGGLKMSIEEITSAMENVLHRFGIGKTEVKPATFSEQDVKRMADEAAAKAREVAAAEFAEREKALELEAGKIRAQAKAAKLLEFKEFAEGLKKAGQITPAMDSGIGVVSFMDAISEGEAMSFGEKGENQTVLEWFMAFCEALPKQVEFAEVAGGDPGPANRVSPEVKDIWRKQGFSEDKIAEMEKEGI